MIYFTYLKYENLRLYFLFFYKARKRMSENIAILDFFLKHQLNHHYKNAELTMNDLQNMRRWGL